MGGAFWRSRAADGPTSGGTAYVFAPPCLRHTLFLGIGVGGGGLASSFARGPTAGIQLKMGYRTAPLGPLALELTLVGGFQSLLTTSSVPNLDSLGLARMGGEARLYLLPLSALQPYLLLGAELHVLSVDDLESYTGPGINAGGGLLYWLRDHFALDLELAYHRSTALDSDVGARAQAQGTTALLGFRLYL